MPTVLRRPKAAVLPRYFPPKPRKPRPDALTAPPDGCWCVPGKTVPPESDEIAHNTYLMAEWADCVNSAAVVADLATSAEARAMLASAEAPDHPDVRRTLAWVYQGGHVPASAYPPGWSPGDTIRDPQMRSRVTARANSNQPLRIIDIGPLEHWACPT